MTHRVNGEMESDEILTDFSDFICFYSTTFASISHDVNDPNYPFVVHRPGGGLQTSRHRWSLLLRLSCQQKFSHERHVLKSSEWLEIVIPVARLT
jgi:hypothetical protein